MAISLNLDLLISSVKGKHMQIMRGFSDKWGAVVNSAVHLTIPRGMLFGWGTMILILQTLSVLAPLEVFLQVAGMVWFILFIMFRQYCRVWRRYYSLFWPICVHLSAFAAAIYVKARYL